MFPLNDEGGPHAGILFEPGPLRPAGFNHIGLMPIRTCYFIGFESSAEQTLKAMKGIYFSFNMSPILTSMVMQKLFYFIKCILQAKTKRLRDPTLAQYRARNDEDRVELRCLSGSFLTDKDIEQIRLPPVPLVPLGREGVNATSWVRMPLADIDSTDRRASR